jgi:ketosteroid isomerase-like protein
VASDNVEIVRQLYERVLAASRMEDAATAQIVPQFFDPEVLVRQMSRLLDTAGDFHGYRGLAESAREFVRAFAGMGFVPEQIQAAGDQVATVALYRRTARQSGAPFEGRVCHLFTLRNRGVVRFEVFDEPADAFRAAGLTS